MTEYSSDPSSLEVRDCGARGRGVFALRAFSPGETIEIVPVIVIPEVDRDTLDTTMLYDYYFAWGADEEEGAIALGFGSLYNHSFEPNARYDRDLCARLIRFVAIRTICRDEEVTVNYNGEPSDSRPVWFEVI